MTALIAYGFLARVLTGPTLSPVGQLVTRVITCLLYTSDAADDLLCVDLGGRRINKKKIHTSPPR